MNRAVWLGQLAGGLCLALGSCVSPHDSQSSTEGSGPAGQEPAEGVEEPVESTQEDVLDQVHAGLSGQVLSAAAWLDSFLADERSLGEQNESSMTLRLESFWEERNNPTFKARVKLRFVMPGTTKRLHLILAEYEDDDDVGEFEVPVKQDEFDESSPELGLQYFLLATPSNNLRAETGLRLNGFDPNPYVGVRYRHTEVFEPWALRFRQRFRTYLDEGLESRSILDFERLISERLFFRSTTNASWFEEDHAWFYGQTFSLFHQVSDLSLLTYEWRSEFTSEPEHVLTETRLRMGLNRRIFRDWIGLEISPQVAWREDGDYKPVLGLFVALDFLFGAARRL